jgi:hypothetical protein
MVTWKVQSCQYEDTLWSHLSPSNFSLFEMYKRQWEPISVS